MKLKILQGDTLQRIKELEDESIDLCITSPPYWNLRDYQVEGQLGSEPTLEAYLDTTLQWVKEVERILKPTGSFVLNLGDSFFGSWGGGYGRKGIGAQENQPYGALGLKNEARTAKYYKPQNLISVSSFAYCRIASETDFICRGEHIWAKPNVPCSTRSRLKHSHDKLFWFVKNTPKGNSAKAYYFKKKPWEKDLVEPDGDRQHGQGTIRADALKAGSTSCFRKQKIYRRGGQGWVGIGPVGTTKEKTIEHSWRIIACGERQSGFELAGKQASEHVAPFPSALIRPYVQGMCPPDGTVLDPFLGSGTTMRVAMENHRNAIGIELNPDYIKYAKKRLNWGQGLNVEYEG